MGGQRGHSCAILKDDAAADDGAGQTPGRGGEVWTLVEVGVAGGRFNRPKTYEIAMRVAQK